jgi:putative PIN family toxin of toxin-antitoxin system
VTDGLRAVLDTNVFISAFLSRNPTSPTREILERWQAGGFVLLASESLVDEIAEKLLASQVQPEQAIEFLALLARLAEWVEVPGEAVLPVIAEDPDDDLILACARVGKADFLVTYDTHFDSLEGNYSGVRITKAVPFLWALRGDPPPEG